MREKLNQNPLAQMALVGVLLIAALFFFLKPGGGGESESESGPEVVTAAPSSPELEPAAPSISSSGAPKVPSNRLPTSVRQAIEAERITVLLFVKRAGIDDRRVEKVVADLSTRSDVSSFTVPVDEVARYTAVTQPVGLQRSPALVVVKPRSDGQPPAATVSYGFQTIESAAQAIVDAEYRGPELAYHP
jgi:hypothetical protein